jgi:isopenicillin-N epimerase
MTDDWLLDPDVAFLNHGSFGACPRPVLEAQNVWRERMEREPVRFMNMDLEPALDAARAQLGAFLGASPEDLVFLPNTTTGVSTILRSLAPGLRPTDEVVTTDHEYNASLNALRWLSATTGARLVVAALPFPCRSPEGVLDAVLDRVTARTRLALVSHVTSATALVVPIERLVRELSARGVDTIVDAAHATGMVPVDLDRTGAAYTVGNGHKWLCGPKGSGFLHVRRDVRDRIGPLVISHGANSPRRDRSRFRLGFDWMGTLDPTPYLALPTAIRFVAGLHADGWPGVMAANHALCLEARDIVATALATEAPAPDTMLGSMAALPVRWDLPPVPQGSVGDGAAGDPDETVPDDPLHDLLADRYHVQVPVYAWPPTRQPGRAPLRLLRLSAQRYNDRRDYERLVAAIADIDRSGAARSA